MTRRVLARTDEVPAGTSKIVTVMGRQIGLFNVGGEFFALSNRCPHMGAELCKGLITGLVRSDGPGEYHVTHRGEFLRCPWHGWEFEIRTGQSYCDPRSLKARSFKVQVEHGAELVRGPYVAESFPVTVEEDYLVIDL